MNDPQNPFKKYRDYLAGIVTAMFQSGRSENASGSKVLLHGTVESYEGGMVRVQVELGSEVIATQLCSPSSLMPDIFRDDDFDLPADPSA